MFFAVRHFPVPQISWLQIPFLKSLHLTAHNRAFYSVLVSCLNRYFVFKDHCLIFTTGKFNTTLYITKPYDQIFPNHWVTHTGVPSVLAIILTVISIHWFTVWNNTNSYIKLFLFKCIESAVSSSLRRILRAETKFPLGCKN